MSLEQQCHDHTSCIFSFFSLKEIGMMFSVSKTMNRKMSSHTERNRDEIVEMFLQNGESRRFSPKSTTNVLRQYFRPSLTKKLAFGNFDTLAVLRYFAKNQWYQLQSLDLSGGHKIKLTNTASLQSLRTLKIKISLNDLSFIASLPSLSELEIDCYLITEIPALPQSLESLCVQGYGMQNINRIVSAVNLRKLEINHLDRHIDLNVIGELSSLVHLYLHSNSLIAENLGFISRLTRLEYLNLDFIISNINMEFVHNLLNLKFLRITFHSQHPENFSVLANLVRLEELDLGYCTIQSINFMRFLTNLRKLRFSSFEIRDLTPLSFLVNLSDLFIEDFKGFPANVPFLEKMENLCLTVNRETQEHVDFWFLPFMKNLINLRIYWKQFQESRLISGLTKLEKLELYDTQIDNVADFLRLVSLKNLTISSTRVTDISPLESLPNLMTLDVSRTAVDLNVALRFPSIRTIYCWDCTRPIDIQAFKNKKVYLSCR